MVIVFTLLIAGYVISLHGFWWGLAAGVGYFIGVKLLELVFSIIFVVGDFLKNGEKEPEENDIYRRLAWTFMLSLKWLVFAIAVVMLLPSDLTPAPTYSQSEAMARYSSMAVLFVIYSSILTLISYSFFAKDYGRGLKQWRWLDSDGLQAMIGLVGVLAVLSGIDKLGAWALLILVASFFAAFTATMTLKSFAPHVAGVLLIGTFCGLAFI